MSANAGVYLPDPVITSETVMDGKVKIEWSYDSETEPCTYFQVIVYKKHKATADEKYVIAQSDFSHIDSKGTMSKSENWGGIWDYVPDAPGFWVKMPLYMKNAIGIDTFMYFAGSDNDDVFGGAYMVSPDYDLSGLQDQSINVETALANEATSVTGGFALWAWNTNWFDEKNIDYKPVYDNDFHYTDLSSSSWKEIAQGTLFPDLSEYPDADDRDEINAIDKTRTRVMFYGTGYSAIWINSFKLSVNMKAGDVIDYGASLHNVEGNSFEIDTTADTDNDYVYAYEVMAVRQDYDDYRQRDYIRFTNYRYNTPRKVIGEFAAVDNVKGDVASGVEVSASNGCVVITGAATAQIFDLTGKMVYNGPATSPISLDKGFYLVKAGDKTAKIVL